MPQKKTGRKYGSRADYLKIVKAKAAARKLAKKGVTKVDPDKLEWRINKYGQAVSSSRALNKTAAQWYEATHAGASIRKLTPKQAKALKKEYAHLGEHGPTIKNGRVLVGKGLSLFTKGGHVRIEKSGTAQMGKRIYMTDGWEDRVREYARKHPNEMIFAKRTDLLDKFQTYQIYDMSNFGVEELIHHMNQYSDGGHSVTLLTSDAMHKQLKKNEQALNEYRKKMSAQRAKERRARLKKEAAKRRKAIHGGE